MSADGGALPLKGVRVIEFVHMVMGPTCGLVLGDLGADVIKIEPAPGGDNTRRLSGSGVGFWSTYNRNKKSLSVDLKSEQGAAIVRALLATADVVTENFRPGAMDKLGLGYDDVKKINPRAIYCSMKGFLPGPYDHRTALDEVVQMMSGLAYMTGPEGRPLRAGASVNDVMGGMFGAIGILSALIEREKTGSGQLVKSGLYENAVFLMAQHMAQFAITGQAVAPMPSRLSSWAIYDIFATLGGGQLFVGVVTDSQWKKFCTIFEMPELGNDTTLASNTQRVGARDRIMPAVQARFAAMSNEQLIERCEAAGLPYAPILRPEDLFDDRHLIESNGMTDITLPDGRSVKLPMLPFEMDGRRFAARMDAPALGSHADELLAEIGYTPEQVEDLRRIGVIAGPPA